MARDVLTLALEGETIPLEQFSEAMRHFYGLLSALTSEIADDTPITWVIDSIEQGSAILAVRAEEVRPEIAERIAQGYLVVGDCLAENKPIPYSEAVRKQAIDLTKILNGYITSVCFVTGYGARVVTTHAATEEDACQRREAFGIVRGVIDTLQRRPRLRFTLYDSLFDNPVYCHPKPSQEANIREAWGKRAVVAGRIRRDSQGRPRSITDIRRVRILPDVEPGSYKNARGVLPDGGSSETSEQIIRKMRDA